MFGTSIQQILTLFAIGALGGTIGGMLGVGGGLVMIPAMLFLLGDHFGPDSLHLYKLAAITTSVVVAIPAAVRHWRERAVVFRALGGIVPLALVGVLAGVWAASLFSGAQTRVLKQIFGGFLEFVVAFNVFQMWRASHGDGGLFDHCPMPSRRGVYGWIIGFPAGLTAGLLGVGGGIWAVPAQRLFLGVQLRNAIATSAAMIVAVALTTALAQSIAVTRIGALDPLRGWWLSLWLAPGAVVGGWVGAGLTHRLPVPTLRHAFHVLLVFAGIRLMFY